MGELIIAGRRFAIEAPLINWHQSGWDATAERCLPVPGHGACPDGITPYGAKAMNRSPRRYALRPQLRRYQHSPPLEAVKALVRQFVLHHDGCSSAAMCWNVLHNERGLSCHFLIDNDGTIYQTLDIAFMAYHAAQFNVSSIGVEFSNRGDAKKEPDFYLRRSQKRDVRACKINGHTYLAYDFTRAQYDSFTRLARALTRLLPNLPVEYPQKAPGEQAWETLATASGYAGYLGHYHCTAAKWDPGPFDIKAFCKKLRGTFSFPMFPRHDEKRPANEKPEVPARVDELKAMARQLFDANEQLADGGYFPVGPWGQSRLWHGGVHLAGAAGQPLFSPFPGRVVAARMSAPSAVGSTSFVLLRHELTLGAAHVRFFSLFMHVLAERDGKALPEWMTRDGWKAHLGKGTIALLDEPVEAGQLVAHMGSAGPDELSRPQVHLEIFSTSPLFTELEASPWEVVDGTAGGRFCDVPEIRQIIDSDRDGTLSRRELSEFYRSGGDDVLRYQVTLHASEWTAEPAWAEALRTPSDFRDVPAAELEALVAEQILPGLWWNAEVARHARLPIDGVVYHYHPISFLRWFNEKLLETGATEEAVNAADARSPPPGVTDDLGDESGAHAVSAAEIAEDECDKALTLELLVQGYDAPECEAP
jgi:N-acetyl-anhydromuramyl-L-alanine amidase AmpD